MVEQINSIAQLWWSWMLPMFWQASLLIVIIALVDLFLRKRVWPQVRYALWLLVLIKLIIPPGFALSTSIVSQIRAHLPQKETQVVNEIESEEPSTFNIASENLLPDIRSYSEPGYNRPVTFPERENFAFNHNSAAQPYTSSPAIVSEKAKLHWKAILMSIWLVGVAGLLCWAIMRYHALRKRFCIQSKKINAPKWFEPLLNETAQKLKLRKLPQIAFSNNLSSPAVFGTFKPVLVLPSNVSLSQKSMEHILLHEFAHIKRLDMKVNTLTTLMQIVYWFNPLLFFAGKRLRHIRELCCDATVARILRENTSDYRMTIMECAQRYFTKPTELGIGLLGLFEDSSSLANRLNWLEKKTWEYRTLQFLAVLVVVTLMSLYILPMAKAKKVEAAETSISQNEQTDDSQIDPRERATLTGKIIDTDGKPVGKAEITLYKRYSVRNTNNVILHKAGKTITSKDDGTFVLNTQKRLWMMNFRDELGSFEEGLVVVQKDGLALNWAKWDINEDKNLDFTLTKSQSVDGMVVDETGKPVPGAHVRSIIYRGQDSKASINDWLPGISPIDELETTSDNQGRFKISDIPENCYVDFVVKAKGKACISTYKKEIGPEFKAGQKNVRIVLLDEGFIEGKIVDINTGKGIPGVQVIAIPHNPSEPLSGLPRFSSSYFEPLACLTNQEGIFKIGSIAEGYYVLAGDIPFKDGIFVEKGKTTSEINVDCDGYVYGYVKDINGNPIANAEVHIRPAPESINIPSTATRGMTIIHNGKTDENGYYLVNDIKGYYTVGATAFYEGNDNENQKGYRHIYIKKDETFHGSQQVDFQFGTFPEGNATLVGEVKDQNGDILTDFYVQLSSVDDDPEQSKFSFGLKEIQYTIDGTFEYKNLPAGKYRISMNSLDESRQYEFPFFHDITLEENKINKEFLEVLKKQAYYGRVLFEDGTPVYFDPPPWPDGTGRVMIPGQFGIYDPDYCSIDKDGYFEAFLKDEYYESIKNGEFEMKISVPSLELERVSHYANVSFPPEKLSTDKSNAWTIKIAKQSDELELNPQNAPSLLQKEVPDFNGIEINTNLEKEENKNITIRGYITDKLGRPRGNVYITPEGINIWDGKRSDLQGHFVLEDARPEQKKWVAYSQSSRALGLFSIPDNYDGKPIHVTLDYIEGNIEGRIIGEQGQGLRGQQVELLLTTKDGLTYIFPSSQRTDSQGNYGNSQLPFGSGLKIQARLKTTRDEWKKYITEAIEIPENQIFIQIPTLVIGEGKPEESDDGKILYNGRIVNEEGNPIANAKVEVNYQLPDYMSSTRKFVMTDSNGRWKRRIPANGTDISIHLIHPEYISQTWQRVSIDELRNGTNVMVMKRGIKLSGIVKNERGEPIENALVDTGGGEGWTPLSEVLENHTTPRTLSDGSFSVDGLIPESKSIIVSAFGYAPRIVPLDIVENMEPFEVTLDKGRTYAGQIVDANNNPIEAARIELDELSFGNDRYFIINLSQTDANGIFKMENLPEVGTIRLGFAKSGFMRSSMELSEDFSEIGKIVLYKVPVFTGKVIDAETEKPITRFSVTSGIKSSGFGDSIHWNKYYKEEVRSATGSFSKEWSGYAISYPFDGICQLRVEAEGYLTETAPPMKLGEEYEPAVIRMTKGTPFTGTISDNEGKPIRGAEVGWVGPDKKAFITNGKFDQRGFSDQTEFITRTNPNGEFELPPSRDEGLIVAVHENKGYESISSEDFENGSQIKLKPWAKIEGTIISSDENRKEYNVVIDTAVSDEELSAKKIRWMFNGTTYSQKNFVINFVPSEPFYICQYINSERMKKEYLEPQPGQTYKVELSDEPGVVSGRIIEPESLEGKELPRMSDIKINPGNEQPDTGMTLICFWDFEQRPSRNMITQLSKRIQELEEKGISVITINTSDTEQEVLDDWLKEQNINLKVGKITEDIEKTKFKWGVKSLPWLILTDKNNIVLAEGFNLEDLDEKNDQLILEPQPEIIKYTGQVTDTKKQPVSDAIIQIYAEREGKLITQTKCNNRGIFEIEFEPPWIQDRQLLLLCISENHPPAWRTMPYSSAEKIQIKLKEQTQISGKIVDSEGKGIADAKILFQKVEDTDYGEILFSRRDEIIQVAPSTKTDNDGNFTIRQVPLGSDISLRVEHPEYTSETESNILAIGPEVKIEDIQLPDGAIIEGTVCFADTGKPAQGVIVKSLSFNRATRQTVTDNNGKYLLKGIEALDLYEDISVSAEYPEENPEWAGQIVVENDISAGEHLTGIDITLEKSFEYQQKIWLAQQGKEIDGPRIVVLDDNDRAYNGKTYYDDTVTMYNGKGQQLWQKTGFNTCQSIGAKHSIAYNKLDKSIWLVEEAGKRLVKIDTEGNVLLKLENIRPNSIAIDPKTGNLWVLTTEGTIYGDNLVILNSKGEIIKELSYKGFDIAYSEKDDCFWLAGKEVMSINRDYQAHNWWPGSFEWVAVSVNINNNDGSVWVSEGRHPQVEGSKNQILILESDGKTRKKINLEEYGRTTIAIDSRRNTAWVATKRGILKMNLDGEIIKEIPLSGFSICLEPDTGYVWVGDNEGIYRLDLDGKLVWSKETPGGSQKWLCAIPD